jgi:YbbR domain-containing protein
MKKLFTANIGLKIAAILLSVILWFYVTTSGQSEISLDVPLEFKNIPQGLEIVQSSAKVVSLNLQGQERLIKNIKLSEVRVSVDLSKAKKGEGTYPINRETIKLPQAASVKNVTPSSIKVITDATVTKTVKVMPVIVGTPRKGFSIKSLEIEPEIVVIEGIMTEVRKVNILTTEPIDVTDIQETFTQDFRLDISDINIRTKTKNIKVTVVITGRRK